MYNEVQSEQMMETHQMIMGLTIRKPFPFVMSVSQEWLLAYGTHKVLEQIHNVGERHV